MVMNVFFDGYEWLLLMLWPCRDPVPIRFRSLRTSPTVNCDQVAVNAIGCMPGVSWRFHWKSSVLFKLSSSTGHNKTITNLDILCIYIYIYMYTYNIYIYMLLLASEKMIDFFGLTEWNNRKTPYKLPRLGRRSGVQLALMHSWANGPALSQRRNPLALWSTNVAMENGPFIDHLPNLPTNNGDFP